MVACMAKTTVEISESLLAAAKSEAATRRTTLRALIEEGLERLLSETEMIPEFRLRTASVGGEGAADWHEMSTDERTALMYGS